MKILLLCNKSPWPPREGGPIAMYAILDGLVKAGHEVTVLAANTNKYHIDPAKLPADLTARVHYEFADIDLRIKPVDALVNYLSGESYHVTRFRNRGFGEKLIRLLSETRFDVIQFETLYTAVYLDIVRRYSKALVILRAHNIEHLIWKRIAGHTSNPLKKHYLNHLYLTLKHFELDTFTKVDGIAAITATDADFIQGQNILTPVVPVPFGVDTGKTVITHSSAPVNDLFHIGSMNWLPNVEGIEWFLEKVWPAIRKTHPALNFHLAGRMMPEKFQNSGIEGVISEGEVPDAAAFMNAHGIMVVPLFSGSGIRIKIIEAMLAGKAIVTTPVGAEGINVTNRENILLAHDRDSFISAVNELLADDSLAGKLGRAARELILKEHDNHILIQKLTGFYSHVSATAGVDLS